MKKLISVLLAVSSLALSTSAFAAAPSVTSRNSGATAFADAATGTLPCFRNGDSVTFNLSGLSGDTLTLISYKNGSTAGNDTIQYINQYSVTGNAQSVTYKIRNLANGTYSLLFKDGDATVASYYYNVANPSVALAQASADASDYIVANDGNGTLGFAAVASIEGASFAEAGVAGVGFTFQSGDKSAKSADLTAAQLDTIAGEVSGKVNVVYGVSVAGVPEGTTITPAATMTDVK